PAVEAGASDRQVGDRSMFARFSGIDRSHRVVLKLSGLFALDSFGGGFVIQSFAAYWFYLRFGVDPRTLGTLFFAANVFAGCSAPSKPSSRRKKWDCEKQRRIGSGVSS